MTIQEIIEQAKTKYPVSVYYNGRLAEDDINELEKECEVHCSSVYMDGTGAYSIRYRKEQKQMTDVKYEYGCEITSTTECPLRKEVRAEK